MAPAIQLSRATEADIDEMLDPLFAAFESLDVRTIFFGHDNLAGRAGCKERIAGWMREGDHNVWLKVTDSETGKIIGASWWLVYPHWTPNPTLTPAAVADNVKIDFLPDGDDAAMATHLMRDFVSRRAHYTMHHPHILLACCFTAPHAQRRGVGSLQVQWGAALAEQLMVPWWVEASAAGHALYAAHGAVDVEQVRTEARGKASDGKDVWVSAYTMMKGEPRRTVVEREARAVKN